MIWGWELGIEGGSWRVHTDGEDDKIACDCALKFSRYVAKLVVCARAPCLFLWCPETMRTLERGDVERELDFWMLMLGLVLVLVLELVIQCRVK